MNKDHDQRIKKILSGMTTEQKAGLCSGHGNWFFRGLPQHEIKEIMVCDGPHGLRKMAEEAMIGELEQSIPATCFPTAAGLAASWNRELIGRVGEAIAEEAETEGVSVVLGPGANIKRSPLCGRNFEYFSEDPLLSGELAAAMINGIQQKDIGCSLKHFAVNNQEDNRMTIDALVDERSLREIYLAGFERAVKQSSPWTIMCAYNRLNGDYLSDNQYILDQVLRKEWGFEGIVISDWAACNDRLTALRAGMEIEMPYSGRYNIKTIIDAVNDGLLSEEILNTAAARIISIMLKSNDKLKEKNKPAIHNFDAHHLVARKAAVESIVLLKNDDYALPLHPDQKLLIAGEFAVNPRYQGAGSSRINPTRVENFLDNIRIDYPQALYSQGYSINSTDDILNKKLITKAVAAAADSDTIVVLAGLPDEYESEGFDRRDMKLPDNHNKLIEALINTRKPVIVCLSNGSPVEMPWNHKAAAIIECYLGGQAGAAALVDILTGRENPSGKLAESFPLKLEDNPSHSWFPGGPRQVEYREGIYVGYRYYDKAGLPVLYPFGHGLSYTSFEYSKLTVDRTEIAHVDDETAFSINVRLRIKNTGSCTGSETVQLYIGSPENNGTGNNGNAVHRPVKELKEFTKLNLNPGEDTEVFFKLDYRSFAYYNSAESCWSIAPGTYNIMAASSSDEIRLSTEITIGFATEPAVKKSGGEDYFEIGNKPEIIHFISEQSFTAELGQKLPENTRAGGWSRTSTLTEFSKTLIGKIILRITMKMTTNLSDNNENSEGMFEAMARSMPLRALAQLSTQTINIEMVDAFIMIGNGRFFSGLTSLVKAFITLKHEQAMDQIQQD